MQAMKDFKAYLVAIAAVTIWGIFSCIYLGLEDGSSGLSPFGWLRAIFFIPGSYLFMMIRGSHSNANLPVAAGIGWLAYTLLAAAITHAFIRIRKRRGR